MFISLLHYLAGHYAELEDLRVYGKIWFDDKDMMFGRRGKYTRIIYYLNLGAIPDEVRIEVYRLPEKKFMGGIEEGFLERLRQGDIFVLGGKLYRFRSARAMRCFVEGVPSEASPTIPAWFSELLPLSFDLALEIQAFRRVMKEKVETEEKESIQRWLLEEYPIDSKSANLLYEYFREQHLYAKIPTMKEMLMEETYDLQGRRFLVFHLLFGRRTNDPLSRALAILLTREINHSVAVIVNDNGFALMIPEEKNFSMQKLLEELTECELEELLKQSIRKTAVRRCFALWKRLTQIFLWFRKPTWKFWRIFLR